MLIQLPLTQHIGPPCSAEVKAGDSVRRGQLIARPTGLGARLHSSVDGRVEEVTEKAIFITADEEQAAGFEPIPEFSSLLEAVEYAGVVGAGGAGFPTHVKLKTQLEGGCVIANAAECEPLLSHNIQYVEQHAAAIVRGLNYLREMTGASKGYVAIKPKYKKAVIELKKALSIEKGLELFMLPDMYPAGDERVIVRELLGIELVPGELPLKAGAVIDNVETIRRIVEAIENRKPVITKDLTVAGRLADGEVSRVFLDVPLGEPLKKYIDLAGGIQAPTGEIVAGGPFTGKRMTEDSPVVKTTGGILVGMPFPQESRPLGLLACECGAQEPRLREIAAEMGATVVAVEKCKRMTDIGGGRFRCDLPGVCPGQAEKVLSLKRQGAQALLVGTCGD